MSGSLGNIKAETAKATRIAQVKKAHLKRFVKLPGLTAGTGRQLTRIALVTVYVFWGEKSMVGRW